MSRRTIGFLVAGAVVSLVLAFGVSRMASSQPDGLERVAVDEGLDSEEREHTFADGAFADYSTEGIDDDGLGTGVAGVIGVAVTFLVAGGLVWVGRRVAGGSSAPPPPVSAPTG